MKLENKVNCCHNLATFPVVSNLLLCYFCLFTPHHFISYIYNAIYIQKLFQPLFYCFQIDLWHILNKLAKLFLTSNYKKDDIKSFQIKKFL